MFSLKFENNRQNVIELTGNETDYQIINIEGLNPPNANIRRSEMARLDGSRFVSSKLEERNIVITIRINGDVERNRINLYTWFRTKNYVKMYYSNGSRNVYIEGWVETVECDLFTMSETMQVSIVCPDPYFKDLIEISTDISQIIGLFEFPFSFGAGGIIQSTITDPSKEFSQYVKSQVANVYNAGAEDTGLIIKIIANDTITNPIINKLGTDEFIKVNTTLNVRDVLTIDTNQGHKSITLLRDGETTNLINSLEKNSTWLMLNAGDNIFSYDFDDSGQGTSYFMSVIFSHRTKYGGV